MTADEFPSTPRMIDVAREAGVSRMAVSAVLMGTGAGRVRVAAPTAERIRAIAAQMGYRPNQAARQLSGRGSGVIALVAHDSRNYLTQGALSRLHETADSADLRVMVVHGRRGFEPVRQLARDLRSGWIDGLVYLAHENESQWAAVRELFRGLPHTVIAVGDLHADGVASVVSDVASGAHATMLHVLNQGRRRPVFVTEERSGIAIQTRIAALQDAARGRITFGEEQIVVATKHWDVTSPDQDSRFDGLARQLVADCQADAILCDTDFTAAGLLPALRRLGCRVPDDVAVVGWGDLQFAGLFDPRITTVSYDMSALLARVVERLTGSSTESESVPMRLIVRASA